MSSPIVSTDFDNSATSQTLCDAFRDKLLNNGKHQQLLAYLFDANGDINAGTTADTTLGRDLAAQIFADNFPIGEIRQFLASPSLNTSIWIKCEGQSLDEDDYPLLAAYARANFSQTGATTGNFLMPDLRGKFLLASGAVTDGPTYAEKATGGEHEHVLTTDEIPAHAHTVTFDRTSAADIGPDELFPTGNDPANYDDLVKNTSEVGGGLAHNNMPPYWACGTYMRAGWVINGTAIVSL